MPNQVLPSFTQAGLFSFIGNILTEQSLAALGALLMIYLAYIVKKELLPLLHVKRNREMARYVLIIADNVTDHFRAKFPQAHWSVWLDRAVDKIMEITGIGREGARRVAEAAMTRKSEYLNKK